MELRTEWCGFSRKDAKRDSKFKVKKPLRPERLESFHGAENAKNVLRPLRKTLRTLREILSLIILYFLLPTASHLHKFLLKSSRYFPFLRAKDFLSFYSQGGDRCYLGGSSGKEDFVNLSQKGNGKSFFF